MFVFPVSYATSLIRAQIALGPLTIQHIIIREAPALYKHIVFVIHQSTCILIPVFSIQLHTEIHGFEPDSSLLDPFHGKLINSVLAETSPVSPMVFITAFISV